MKKFWTAAAFLLLAATAYLTGIAAASAQVPPHPPGSICATQTFWCWAAAFGQVGTPCTCPAGGGFVPGVYV